MATDRYTLHPEQLANLALGQELKRRDARERRDTIGRHMALGRSVADIALLTGYSRAAIYRHLTSMNTEPHAPPKPPSRRRAALAMLADGKSPRETADALGLSPETVRYYRWVSDPLLD